MKMIKSRTDWFVEVESMKEDTKLTAVTMSIALFESSGLLPPNGQFLKFEVVLNE